MFSNLSLEEVSETESQEMEHTDKMSTMEIMEYTGYKIVQKCENININILRKIYPVLKFVPRQFNEKLYMIQICGESADGVLFMTTDLLMYGLGNNRNSQLGIGYITETQEPLKIETLCGKKIKKLIYLSKPIVFVLTEEGQIYSWGSNENSILGLGDTAPSTVVAPHLIYTLMNERIVDIVSGGSHAVALTEHGKVYLWGKIQYESYSYGLLPSYEYKIQNLPKIYSSSNVVVEQICCGENFTIVLTRENVCGLGVNDKRQLGIHKEFNNSSTFEQLFRRNKIIKIVCGNKHAVALDNEGCLYTWGSNEYRQLGRPIHECSYTLYTKRDNNNMGKMVDIAALPHRNVTVALNNEGRVYLWGHYDDQYVKPTEIQVSDMYEVFGCDLPYIITSTSKYSDNSQNTDKVSDLFQNIKTMFNDSSMSDLTIRVKGQPIYVHKMILNIRSKYFRNMFQQAEWKKSNQNVIEHDRFSYDVFKTFLKYLYTDKIDLPVEKTLELLILADTYKETNLINCCIQILKSEFAIKNIDRFITMTLNTIRKN